MSPFPGSCQLMGSVCEAENNGGFLLGSGFQEPEILGKIEDSF